MVRKIADYKWSSYNEYVDKSRIVNMDCVLQMFSANRTQSTELFKKYSKEKKDDQYLEYEKKVKMSPCPYLLLKRISARNISTPFVNLFI